MKLPKTPASSVEKINKEIKNISARMSDRFQSLYENQSSLTVKDHKDSFYGCRSSCIINPTNHNWELLAEKLHTTYASYSGKQRR